MTVVEIVDADLKQPPAMAPAAMERRVDAFTPAVRELLSALDAVPTDDDLVLVPDCTYPHHPSSGLVTEPALVAALARVVTNDYDVGVSVVGAAADVVERERTMELLGYEELLAGEGATLTSPSADQDKRICHWKGNGEEPTWFAVPGALIEQPVIVVPSLRPSRDGGVAASIRTLARAIDPALPDLAAVAAADIVEPALGILDGAVGFTDRPTAAGLLAGGEPAALDAVVAQLLSVQLGRDAVLAEAVDHEEVTVQGGSRNFEGLQASLGTAEYPTASTPGGVGRQLYEFYASAAGDVVPPHLEAR